MRVSYVAYRPKDSKLKAAPGSSERYLRTVRPENTARIDAQPSFVSNLLIVNIQTIRANKHAVLIGDICGIERDACPR